MKLIKLNLTENVDYFTDTWVYINSESIDSLRDISTNDSPMCEILLRNGHVYTYHGTLDECYQLLKTKSTKLYEVLNEAE